MRLEAGEHKIVFKTDNEKNQRVAIDCFTFVRIPFLPSGTNKPTVGNGTAGPEGWFPVIFGDDPLSPDSVIDVSHLIDAPASKQRCLQRDGATLRFERATRPVKFWGVGGAPGGKSPEQMVEASKWFRKHGINLARQHTVLSAIGLMDADGKFDKDRMDRYDRWFATLKEQCIYTTWSMIYPRHGRFLQKYDHPELREIQKAEEVEWAKKNGKKIDLKKPKQVDEKELPLVVNDYINLDRRLQDVACGTLKN